MYVVYPEVRCDVCQRKINTMNPGKVMAIVKETAPPYHVHKGRCMDKLSDDPPDKDWGVDNIHDHFFRLLAVLGFIAEDGQIVLEEPV